VIKREVPAEEHVTGGEKKGEKDNLREFQPSKQLGKKKKKT